MLFLLYKHTDDGIFADFPKISDHFPKISEDFQNCSEGQTNVPKHFPRISENFRRFPKIFQNCSEGQTNVPEHFPWISENSRRCPKISEKDFRRFSRKIRRCFDDTPTNLNTIKETKLISEKLSIIDYRNFTCENIWIFSVAEILIKHWCLYNKREYYCWNGRLYLAW